MKTVIKTPLGGPFLRLYCILIVIALGLVALSPKTQAVTPAPDGGYPGFNTAEGQKALFSLTTGQGNTAVGSFSLLSNTQGQFNTAVGAGTLLANVGDPGAIEGVENTAVGAGALLSNTTGHENTANGAFALFSNTTGFINTAIGFQALFNNTEGGSNVAIGDDALFSNTIGIANIATGNNALYSNTTGVANTAIGSDALEFNTTGDYNTATGLAALVNNIGGVANTATGFHALIGSAGSNNIALGYNAGSNLTSGDNNIYLGSLGVATESNAIRIGTSGVQTNAFIRGIRGVTTGNNDAIPVVIDTAGQLGTSSSSRRFKREIKAMDTTSEAILALKPVTFHYKSDKANTPQFGLIAEEVAEVNPNLVVRDENGEIYTVRYDAVNAMLLNEFLKEHKAFLEEQRKVREQQVTVTQLKSNAAMQEATVSEMEKGVRVLTAQIKEQAGQIQRVRAQLAAASPSRSGLQVSKFARRMVGRIRGGGPVAQTVASNQ